MKSNSFSGVGNLAVIESAQPLCFRVRILEDSKENKRHAGCLSDWGCWDLEGSRRFSLQPLKLPLAKGKMDDLSIIQM